MEKKNPIPKGIESLTASVKIDCESGENCFNEQGCDHEFTRMVPQDNPKLIEMGFNEKCISVSKCSHKYCDKFKSIVDMATGLSEKSGVPANEIIEALEVNRSYWYMNYYSERTFNPKVFTEEALQNLEEKLIRNSVELISSKIMVNSLPEEDNSKIKQTVSNEILTIEKRLALITGNITIHKVMLKAK